MTTLHEHKPKLGGRVRQDSRPMTGLVAIFDNAWTMQQAIERLVARGYDEAVYDEAIISENTGEISVPQAKRAAGPGKPNLPPKPDRNEVIRAFKARLGDYGLSDEVIEGYAMTFLHDGKFVLVKTEPERAEQAMEILRECAATRVTRYE